MNIFCDYFFQKFFENNTSIVKISSLPTSIVIAKIHLDLSFKFEQLPFGPIISPIPGPTFEIADAEADKAVKKSNSKKLNVIDDKINIKT